MSAPYFFLSGPNIEGEQYAQNKLKFKETIKTLNELFHGENPFIRVEPSENDEVHGWLAQPEIFDQVIAAMPTKFMIEVGTWQGKSAIYAASKMRETTSDFGIICVDTWLGSIEHRMNPNWRKDLKLKNGFPQIYESFLSNIVKAELQDHIFPLPLPSVQAATYLRNYSLQVPIVYIDGGHDYSSVKTDLENYWPLVGPSGVLFGDDYSASDWPGVVQAVDEFFENQKQKVQIVDCKYIVQKTN